MSIFNLIYLLIHFCKMMSSNDITLHIYYKEYEHIPYLPWFPISFPFTHPLQLTLLSHFYYNSHAHSYYSISARHYRGKYNVFKTS